MESYEKMMKELAKGWNTWNTRSVLSHVLLPEAFAMNLCLKEYANGQYLKEALIGRYGEMDEIIHPGAHAYDASYTSLNLKWREIEMIVESAVYSDELYLLITPVRNQMHPAALVLETGFLWNQPGTIAVREDRLEAVCPGRIIEIYTTKEPVIEKNIPTQAPYIAMNMDRAIGISTGKRRTVEEIASIIEQNRAHHEKSKQRYGSLAEVYNALQSTMAWDTIYEPQKGRVVTPVSRLWNIRHGGYALFCWDNYFAAYLASVDNKELAYANAVEITREKTGDGFVPNTAWGTGYSSYDRSQPPVGSLVVKELYRKYRDRWLLEELFDDLYAWNTWFVQNRECQEGLMAWGSNPYPPQYGCYWETAGVNDTYGGALESGLDNSPMYDGVPFNKEKHFMMLADVGLTGLYIMDCRALAEIAEVLGRSKEANELQQRMKRFEKGLQRLWDNEKGFFLNKRLDTEEFSNRISPTNFYALMSDAVSSEQASRMLDEHFYNPEEFWGEWILPSISRNDPAYPEQDYWRGRIWAPMNFLVYLGLRRHRLSSAQKELAEKSQNLLMKEWMAYGHVHENYSADTGEGCGSYSSDKFYHWGALLAIIALIEGEYVPGPEEAL